MEEIKVGDYVRFKNSAYSQIAIVSDIFETEPKIVSFKKIGYCAKLSEIEKLPFKNGDFLIVKQNFNTWMIIFKEYEDFKIHVAYIEDSSFFHISGGPLCNISSIDNIRYMTPKEKDIMINKIKSQGFIWDENLKSIFPFYSEKEHKSKKSFWKRLFQ